MNIKVLGTRGEIDASAPWHRKKSGVLLDNKILLDVGDERFLSERPACILITHLHPDHAYFVRHGETPSLHAIVYAPEPYKTLDIRLTQSAFTFDHYQILPIPTIHSVKVQSTAYLITHGHKKILYTGDMIWIKKEYHHLLHDIDLVITEASFMKYYGMIRRDQKTGRIFGHTGIPNLIRLFKPYTHTILFVHFGSWFFRNIQKAHAEFAQLAQENNMKLIVGYDGLELKI